MAIQKKPLSVEEATLKMASLCARSERCVSEIDRKLFQLGLNSSQRRDIIGYLKEEKYIDENRFAKSFVNDKVRFSAWGPYKIRLALSQLKISSSLISETLKTVDDALWEEALMKNARSKARQLNLSGEDSIKEREKIFHYPLSRGFTSSQAKRAILNLKK